jgi:hypothetical protein
MELWNKIFDKWKKQNVPDVVIRKFEIGQQSPNFPWFSIENNSQYIYSENPLNDTAYHLSYIQNMDQELIAAYKILAYLRYYSNLTVWSEVLAHAMTKHDKKLYHWWNANAKNILPYTQNCNTYIDKKLYLNDWEKLVEQSANLWKDIAKEWEIIKIPDHMNSNSPELKDFQDFERKVQDNIEYQQYLRLKNKFEK